MFSEQSKGCSCVTCDLCTSLRTCIAVECEKILIQEKKGKKCEIQFFKEKKIQKL